MDPMLRAAVAGVGSATPQRVMTNEDFTKIVDTSDEWITTRTGIKERRIATDDDSTLSLAVAASRAALADAGWDDPNTLDLILCHTITPEMPFPATACCVQDALDARDVPAFDLSAACSGFVYGLTIAQKFIETGTYRRILVIASDTLSRFTDYTDRTSCVLFGDAAGAAVLEATDQADRGLLYTVLHADGRGWDYIHVPAGGARRPPTHETVERREHFIKMRGRDVYKFAVEKMQWLLGDCMAQCNLTPDDVALVVPHQVNIRILESAAKKHHFPMDKVYVNIDKYGNTSGASVPLALDEARRSGRIGPGDIVMLIAFGAGLTWAGAVLKL